jgi:hypothetical protein
MGNPEDKKVAVSDVDSILEITRKIGDRSKEEEKTILGLLPKDREPTDMDLVWLPMRIVPNDY